MIKRGKEHNAYNESYPNTTLCAKYDVTKQIYLINQANQIQPSYSWVKGHQDDKTDFDDLPLLAQLNIKADRILGQFQTFLTKD